MKNWPPYMKVVPFTSVIMAAAIISAATGGLSTGATIAIVAVTLVIETAVIVWSTMRQRGGGVEASAAESTPAASGDEDLDELVEANPGMDFSSREQ